MSQFDVHRLKDGKGLVIDCQSDLLAHLNTRFLVPLLPLTDAPAQVARLHPSFVVDREEYVAATHLAAAVPLPEIGEFVVSLRDRSFEIVSAFDVLISGV